MATLTGAPPQVSDKEAISTQENTTGVPWAALLWAPWPALVVQLPRLRVIAANDAANRMFRATGQTLVGSDFGDLASTEDEQMKGFLERLALTGISGASGLALRGIERTHWVEVQGVMYAEAGQVRACLTLKDVTERKQRVSRLVHALLDARQALARKSELADLGREVVAAQGEIDQLVLGAMSLVRFAQADLDAGRAPHQVQADLHLAARTLETCRTILRTTEHVAAALGTVEFGDILGEAVEQLQGEAQALGNDIEVHAAPDLHLHASQDDLVRLTLSAIRAFLPHGALSVRAEQSRGSVQLEIHRRGEGPTVPARNQEISQAEFLARRHGGRLQVVLGARTLLCVVSLPALAVGQEDAKRQPG